MTPIPELHEQVVRIEVPPEKARKLEVLERLVAAHAQITRDRVALLQAGQGGYNSNQATEAISDEIVRLLKSDPAKPSTITDVIPF